jgi:hypothetical protein
MQDDKKLAWEMIHAEPGSQVRERKLIAEYVAVFCLGEYFKKDIGQPDQRDGNNGGWIVLSRFFNIEHGCTAKMKF